MRAPVSTRSLQFTESVIREMTRVLLAHHGDRGVNLAQGFPDFPAPQAIKDAACRAIQEDLNQYAITWGTPAFRNAIARKMARFQGLEVDPESEITVCCGATEAMMATIMAVVDPGDEVVVFEPFYENYGPDCLLTGAVPRYVPLHEPDYTRGQDTWSFDGDELASAFGPRTKAIIINTPHNPTGKVFSRQELQFIATLCQRWDTLAITDEIYEHLVYRGEHVSMATIPGMRERTVTINGLSKTYSVTGWRLGYAIAPSHITSSIRKVHDFLTVGAAHPLQAAAAVALELPDEYYHQLLAEYRERRDFALAMLEGLGFRTYPPDGAYYIMTDISPLGAHDDVEFCMHMVREYGVAAVPGSSFYSRPELGRTKVRFAFPKKLDTLRRARDLLERMQRRG